MTISKINDKLFERGFLTRPLTAQRGLKSFMVPYLASLIVKGGVTQMYAIIKTGGKQYKVAEGDSLVIEKLEVAEGETVVFDQVLTYVNEAQVKIGQPLVQGANVKAKVLEHGKGDKILVFKYKAKSNYRRRQGHRQPFTKVQIEKIEA